LAQAILAQVLARGILSSFAQRLGVYYALNDGDIDTG